MKFSITIYDKSLPEKKNYRTVAKCATLEDACAALLGLANVRRGQEVSYNIIYRRSRKETSWGGPGISCQLTNSWPDLASLIRQGKAMLVRYAESEKQTAIRHQWLKAHPQMLDLVMKDDPTRAAFAKGDFESAARRAQELGIAA